MANFFETLVDVLKADERLFSQDGSELLRNKVYELAMAMDAGLLALLLGNEETKKRFFTDVNGTLVFDKMAFGWVVNNRQFLPDSYTRFKNRIGLADGTGSLLSASNDVVLLFPHKDCVLEGGQTKEDQKRDEIFYNETLAPDEVDRLLYPKVLVKATKYEYAGDYDLTGLPVINAKSHVAVSAVTQFTDNDNLVLKGNNLLSLASVLSRYERRVKLIYIDPPFNTGGDTFRYNDAFNHSAWLVFMKNRLELARRLLTPDGSIYVHLDYNEVHYCKLLLDEIFGRDCFQREIIWDTQVLSGYKTLADNWIRGHDSILFYTREATGFKFHKQKMPHRKEYLDRFDKVDENGRRYFDGRGKIRYLDEAIANGKPVGDVWYDIMSFQQIPTAKERVEFSTQKPEALLQRIIQAATDEGDIVLDFFAGSGTTGVVAHKLKRRYIMCEQMEGQCEVELKRLGHVVEGKDPGSLASELNWQGGGSFVYCELAQCNQRFVEAVEAASTDEEMKAILDNVLATGYISYKVRPSDIQAASKDFMELSLDDKKRFVMELLDKNMLYVNLSDLDDEEYAISEEDKAFNRSFYRLEE